MDSSSWPEAKEIERPKKLFITEALTAIEYDILIAKGWVPTDVRTLPNQSDAERAESVKAFLEGVRVGSIEADAKKLRFVELEAKLYLLNSKTPSEKKEVAVEQSLDELLSFNSNRAFRGTWQQKSDNVGVDATPPARTKRQYIKKHPQWTKVPGVPKESPDKA